MTDSTIAELIETANRRVIFAAPGCGKLSGEALGRVIRRLPRSVGIVIDSDADPYRIGYADAEGLRTLFERSTEFGFELRKHEGLRIGILIVDDGLLVWSPTPLSVEAGRGKDQPNGLRLSGEIVENCARVIGFNQDNVNPHQIEKLQVGTASLGAIEIKGTLNDLHKNPPVPFDLSQKTRVFSTKFQYVESEVRGIEWTQRRIRLSNLLINADLPDPVRDILDTQIRPFQSKADMVIEAPCLLRGKAAFDAQGNRISMPLKQSEVLRYWSDIRDYYLRQVKGFGWLIERSNLQEFRRDVEAFEETLKIWVKGFIEEIKKEEDETIKGIAQAIMERLSRSSSERSLTDEQIRNQVSGGLANMKTLTPQVRIVFKDISWESTRDAEFKKALKAALRPGEMDDWLKEFTAAAERTGSSEWR